MYGILFVVLFATSYVQTSTAEQHWSTKKTSVTPVPMLIDEDENYVSEACTDDPHLPDLDVKCLTSRVVKNNATYVWYYNSTARLCSIYVTADCPLSGPSRAPSKNRFANFNDCERTCLAGSATTVTSRDQKQRNKQKAGGSRRPQASTQTGGQPCSGLPVTGNCLASVPSWYYDRSTDECAEFSYSGCGGNRNRYASRSECVKQCKGRRGAGRSSAATNTSAAERTETTPASRASRTSIRTKNKGRPTTSAPGPGSKCSDPPVTGICRGSTRSWYYDTMLADCVEFVYSGCGGGSNKYATRESCERSCKTSPASTRATESNRVKVQKERGGSSSPSSATISGPEDVGARCIGRADPGPCRAMMRRYYYSASEGACRQFIYGGCGGSDNRFYTERECMSVCGGRQRNG